MRYSFIFVWAAVPFRHHHHTLALLQAIPLLEGKTYRGTTSLHYRGIQLEDNLQTYKDPPTLEQLSSGGTSFKANVLAVVSANPCLANPNNQIDFSGQYKTVLNTGFTNPDLDFPDLIVSQYHKFSNKDAGHGGKALGVKLKIMKQMCDKVVVMWKRGNKWDDELSLKSSVVLASNLAQWSKNKVFSILRLPLFLGP